MKSGVLPMHRIICDNYNELTGEKAAQTELLHPGPKREWKKIQKNGYVLGYKEDELSTTEKPGYHYRHVASGTTHRGIKMPARHCKRPKFRS